MYIPVVLLNGSLLFDLHLAYVALFPVEEDHLDVTWLMFGIIVL